MEEILEKVVTAGSEQFNQLIEFLKGVDWTEPWIIGLVVFHLVVMVMILLTRKFFNLQCVLFFSLLAAVYFSENINYLGATHWRRFSRQQYFDSHGVFICCVFSGPILINCLILIVIWLHSSSQMLIKVKRAQLREQRQQMEERKTNNEKDKQS